MLTLEERFWSKVAKGQPDECWLWHGSKDHKGYGHLRVSSSPARMMRAVGECAETAGVYLSERTANTWASDM